MPILPSLTTTTRAIRRTVTAAAFLVVATGAYGQATGTPVATTGRPLSPFVSQRVAVLPVQRVTADSGTVPAGAVLADLGKHLDDSIGVAISTGGIGKGWAYAADVVRGAKRNFAFTGDPYAVGVQLIPAKPKQGEPIPEVLASNLRGLIAITDARYALIPASVSVKGVNGNREMRLHLVLIDARAASLIWMTDVVVIDKGQSRGLLDPFFALARDVAALVVEPPPSSPF